MSLERKGCLIAVGVAVFAVILWALLVTQRQPDPDPVLIGVTIGSSALTSVSIPVGMVFGIVATGRG